MHRRRRLSAASAIAIVPAFAAIAACGIDVVGTAPSGGVGTVEPDGGRTGTAALLDAALDTDAERADANANADVDAEPATALLAVTVAPPGPTVDLETEGKTAWIHWGTIEDDVDSRNEKASALGMLATYTVTGSTDVRTYEDNVTTFTWTNGAPVATGTGTTHGVYTKTGNPTITLRRAVGVTTRMRMVVYANVVRATGRFTVTLGAGTTSAPPEAMVELDAQEKANGRFVIDYRALDPTNELVITWHLLTSHDPSNANVTLAAATLAPAD